jgi:hypothetical protein
MQDTTEYKSVSNLPEVKGSNLVVGQQYLIEKTFPGIPGKKEKYIGTFSLTNEERRAQSINNLNDVKYGFTNVEHIPVSKKKAIGEKLNKFYPATCNITDVSQIPEIGVNDLVPGTKYFIVRSPPRPSSFFGIFVEKISSNEYNPPVFSYIFSNIVDITPVTYFYEGRSNFYQKLTKEGKQDIKGDAFCTEIFRRLTKTPEFTLADFSTTANTYLSGKPDSSFYPKGGKTKRWKRKTRKSNRKTRKSNKKTRKSNRKRI